MKKKEKQNKSHKTVILLDAHAILHRAYHALPDFSSQNGEPTGALYGVVTMLLRIIETFNPDHIVACYDLPEPTYRHDAYAEYKATRSKSDDALIKQINRSRDLMGAFGIPIYEAAGFEADDILGTIAAKLANSSEWQVIIASGDMDTMQCIDGTRVQVFTLKKGIKETVLYDEAAVRERFGFASDLIPDYKGLRGDPSDNIPGVPGVGEKTATVLITHFGDLDAIYQTLEATPEKVRSVGIGERIMTRLAEHKEDAYFSKMLATIRTDAPIEYSSPEHSYKECVDLDVIDEIFSTLSFRSLGTRVRSLLGGSSYENKNTISSESDPKKDDRIDRLGIALWLIDSDITNPKQEDLLSYGRSKGLGSDLSAIEAALYEALRVHGLWDLYQSVELPLRSVIKHMHQYGISLDVAQFQKLSDDFHSQLKTIAADIHGHAGCEFNINSPKQLAEVLYDALGLRPKNAKKTAGGQRSTRESELVKLKDEHPIISQILRYRELQKLVSTYIDPLPEILGDDGRLHPTFIQTGTTTGRLACKDPNLQNIPTRTKESKAIRRGFVASPDYELVSIDYSQIELRIAAILSKDPKLVDIFRRGEDVHTGVAVRVFGVDANAVTGEMRRQAKVINFGILYGMGVNALRANLGGATTRAEAQEFLQAYFNTFTRLAEDLEEVREHARSKGYTTTLFNRRRHFPAITSSVPHLRAQAERMAINAPIQGTAADMMRIAMNKVYTRIDDTYGTDQVRILLQVHDELLLEVRRKMVSTVVPELTTEMTDIITTTQQHGVPITVDVAHGTNWADMRLWS